MVSIDNNTNNRRSRGGTLITHNEQQSEATRESMEIEKQKNARKAETSPTRTSTTHNSTHSSTLNKISSTGVQKSKKVIKKKRAQSSAPAEPMFASDKRMAEFIPEENQFFVTRVEQLGARTQSLITPNTI